MLVVLGDRCSIICVPFDTTISPPQETLTELTIHNVQASNLGKYQDEPNFEVSGVSTTDPQHSLGPKQASAIPRESRSLNVCICTSYSIVTTRM